MKLMADCERKFHALLDQQYNFGLPALFYCDMLQEKACISKLFQYCFMLESAGYQGHTHPPLIKIWAHNMKNQWCYVEWNLPTCNKKF